MRFDELVEDAPPPPLAALLGDGGVAVEVPDLPDLPPRPATRPGFYAVLRYKHERGWWWEVTGERWIREYWAAKEAGQI